MNHNKGDGEIKDNYIEYSPKRKRQKIKQKRCDEIDSIVSRDNLLEHLNTTTLRQILEDLKGE
jgi:hypothetical protein